MVKNVQSMVNTAISKDTMGVNTVAHIDKYITISENLGGGKSQFRNVNTETVKRLAVGGKVYTF